MSKIALQILIKSLIFQILVHGLWLYIIHFLSKNSCMLPSVGKGWIGTDYCSMADSISYSQTNRLTGACVTAIKIL